MSAHTAEGRRSRTLRLAGGCVHRSLRSKLLPSNTQMEPTREPVLCDLSQRRAAHLHR